jgi:MFS family permease
VLYFGVRPTALVALLIIFVTLIWGALSQSFVSLEASRIICAWAAACAEILPGVVVRDIFFLHERGRYMGLYMIFFQGGPGLGVIAMGFIITAGGWRWALWVFPISRLFLMISSLSFSKVFFSGHSFSFCLKPNFRGWHKPRAHKPLRSGRLPTKIGLNSPSKTSPLR